MRVFDVWISGFSSTSLRGCFEKDKPVANNTGSHL
jgi:hypothetical protein